MRKILFSINLKQNIVEIKTNVQFEAKAIKQYIEEVCDVELNIVEEEVYDLINQEEVKNAFLDGVSVTGEVVADFLVDKISFRDSPLENSPSVTISLDNIDVMSSVKDASIRGAIDFSSIRSIESISFRSLDTRRTVFTSVLENGNIIFQMDDSRLSETQKNAIVEKFLNRFGIPLYKKISNAGTLDGNVDLVDYILNNGRNLDNRAIEKKEELKLEGILKIKPVNKAYCAEITCGYEEIFVNEKEKPKECPYCEERVLLTKEEQTEVDDKSVNKYIEQKIKDMLPFGDWTYHGKANRTIDNDTYEFIKLEKDNTLFKVLVVYETIPTKMFNKLKKFIEPTLIVLVGQPKKNLDRYSTGCFSAITFGDFYERDLDSLNVFMRTSLDMLNKKTKSFVSTEAVYANENIKENIQDPKANNYRPSDLEDDVYVLLKDIFINVQKWGHEKIAKEYPEGLMTLYFKDTTGFKSFENRLAYSYDCKLNENLKGFKFEIAERDKAKRYIKNLSNSMELSEFANSKHLDGHIFISNKFNEKNAKNTYAKIREDIEEEYQTKIIFLETEALIYLHESYREYYSLIETSKGNFNLLLDKLFKDAQGAIIRKDSIIKLITKTLKYAERNAMDFKELDKDLVGNQL